MYRKFRSIEYVTCSECGHRYIGKVPAGGDGSALYPRKHYRKVTTMSAIGGGHFMMKRKNAVCPGSFKPAKEFQETP